jgi:hypothetical protein
MQLSMYITFIKRTPSSIHEIILSVKGYPYTRICFRLCLCVGRSRTVVIYPISGATKVLPGALS